MDGILKNNFSMGTYSYLHAGTKLKFVSSGVNRWNTYELPMALHKLFGETVVIHESYVAF